MTQTIPIDVTREKILAGDPISVPELYYDEDASPELADRLRAAGYPEQQPSLYDLTQFIRGSFLFPIETDFGRWFRRCNIEFTMAYEGIYWYASIVNMKTKERYESFRSKRLPDALAKLVEYILKNNAQS